MSRRLLFAILFCLSPCGLAAAEPVPPLKALDLKDGDSIVFLGDSITHQCLYTQYVENYFYTRFPHLRLKVHNAGVGGARAWDALQRFDEDVAAYRPKYVTILLGMNDGSYRPYDEETFQTYRRDMSELLDRLRQIDAVPVLMSPTMFDARAARLHSTRERDPEAILLYNSVLAYYGTWGREIALERGFGFVDMWSPLNNITLRERKIDPGFTLIKDAVHPGPDGQVVMAVAIIDDLDLPRRVSGIVLTQAPDGTWSPRTSNGELTDLQETAESLSFTWSARALPWVVPEDARLGAKLTRLGHRHSQEALQVHGLPAGRYVLSIDGVDVGTYASAALAKHIELQENDRTPQYQQALAVATLNQQRNAGPVRSLRGEWSKYQAYARVRRQLEQDPENEDLKNQLAQHEARLAGMEERIAGFNAAARELEDRIFEQNQPRPRKYVLTRAN